MLCELLNCTFPQIPSEMSIFHYKKNTVCPSCLDSCLETPGLESGDDNVCTQNFRCGLTVFGRLNPDLTETQRRCVHESGNEPGVGRSGGRVKPPQVTQWVIEFARLA